MLNIILTVIAIILFYSVMLLLANINERIRIMKGEELDYTSRSKKQAKVFALYGILFLLGFFLSFKIMKFASLPEAASINGIKIDNLFYVTTVITSIVFVICHIALFYFVYKYREGKKRKATFFAHSSTLELLWTTIPALTMAVLVVMGLKVWFDVFPNSKSKKVNEAKVEVTAKQFNWLIRYPGPDGKFGKRVISTDYINPENELGIDWTDPASHDDFFSSELILEKNKPVYFNLGALDVLHCFYLPHFRMKMDCVPGTPTGIGLTPNKTTEETKELLKSNEYWASNNPETNQPRFQDFRYELACAELCGKSHYGMLVNVDVLEKADYKKWFDSQKSYYATNKEKLDAMMNEIKGKAGVTTSNLVDVSNHVQFDYNDIMEHGIDGDKVYETDAVSFAVNSSDLNTKSKSTLDQIAEILKKFDDKKIALAAHTDGDGEDAHNLELSEKRAQVCREYLLSKGVSEDRISAHGYGESMPIADNTTPEGKAKNRRTEFDFN